MKKNVQSKLRVVDARMKGSRHAAEEAPRVWMRLRENAAEVNLITNVW